ncbi:MAG: response regulator transcription factor [Acidobacteria bacterium]|nr:response regulator transcription factor [Acidobacteriota bacterium]
MTAAAPRSDDDKRTVLVVEDDESTATAVAYHLARAGYAVSICKDGLAATTTLKGWRPDALVLDLMLPHVDGWSIIRDVRKWSPDLPIVVMTARQEEAERLEALRLGADDLLRKPFSAKELITRLEAIFRRFEAQAPADAGEVSLGEMEIDRDRLQVRVAGEVAPLTPLETKLLWILLEEKGRTLSRDEIFDRVWGGERQDGDRSVDVLVRRLRRKVDEAGGQYTYVQTELGEGYRLEAVPRAFPLRGRRRA